MNRHLAISILILHRMKAWCVKIKPEIIPKLKYYIRTFLIWGLLPSVSFITGIWICETYTTRGYIPVGAFLIGMGMIVAIPVLWLLILTKLSSLLNSSTFQYEVTNYMKTREP